VAELPKLLKILERLTPFFHTKEWGLFIECFVRRNRKEGMNKMKKEGMNKMKRRLLPVIMAALLFLIMMVSSASWAEEVVQIEQVSSPLSKVSVLLEIAEDQIAQIRHNIAEDWRGMKLLFKR